MIVAVPVFLLGLLAIACAWRLIAEVDALLREHREARHRVPCAPDCRCHGRLTFYAPRPRG